MPCPYQYNDCRTVGARHAVPLPVVNARTIHNGMETMNHKSDRDIHFVGVGEQHTVPPPADIRQSAPMRNRRSTRLQGYNYSLAGAYFTTICTHHRQYLFGDIVDGEMRINDAGLLTQQCWQEIPVHFANTELDAFVVMPNHLHGIVVIIGRGTACRAPTMERFGQPVAGSLPTVVRSFKSAVSKHINALRQTPGGRVWQRNYWEHIIRNELELSRIREYISTNPVRWEMDRLYGQGMLGPNEEPYPNKEAWLV